MGSRHARVFAKLPERFEIVGGYDLCPDVPGPEDAPRLRCEEEAIAAAEVLVVATSTAAHAGVVKRALAAGRHVLVEKPLCGTAAEARAVARLSASGTGLLFVGHSERFNPVVRALVRLLRGERLLAVDLLRVGPTRPADGGVLVNLGVHDFDLAAYLGGAPVALRGAVGGAVSGGAAGEDFAHVLFSTGPGGAAAGHLYVDRTASAKRRQLVLFTPRWVYEGDLL
ncbi:MAG: Gfo/Idh/MocA family oxidoreductase, partial [Myxococcales bacterium]|nr:Gfo/Idh/MocA family oxidoreductase [Myxococcales bacterium]